MRARAGRRELPPPVTSSTEHRLETLCGQGSFTLLFREEWREYKTAQRVSTRSVHRPQAAVPAPPDKKFEVSPNKYWTKAESPHTLSEHRFLCLTPPFPLRAARPWQWSIR